MFVPKYYMSCLNFDITRKCNMNCNFCCRGDSQPIDITREIIDKTLDEMDGVFIHSLKIMGGEPLLAQELMIYLFKSIIEKHIYINHIGFFTNGTTKPTKELCQSISEIIHYLRSIKKEIEHQAKWADSVQTSSYVGLEGKEFTVVISDVGRKPIKNIHKIIESFKHNIDDDDFGIVRQSATFHSFKTLALEGNGAKNYNEIIGNNISLYDIRIVNHNYYFIAQSANLESEPFIKDTVFITKTLTISTNGNVFPGTSMSYDRVDRESMFNVLECNNDFFMRVNDFCWKHPINEKALAIRDKLLAIRFCNKRNITINDIDNNEITWIKTLNLLINKQEELSIDLHSNYPSLNQIDIDLIATSIIALKLIERNAPLIYVKQYLRDCSLFDENSINNLSEAYLREILKYYLKGQKPT